TRWGAASAFFNGGGVLAGGYVNGTATANISTSAISWDPATNAWTSIASMAGERARMSGTVLGNSFYVIGGRSMASAGFVGTNDDQRFACGVTAADLSITNTDGMTNYTPGGNNTYTITASNAGTDAAPGST